MKAAGIGVGLLGCAPAVLSCALASAVLSSGCGSPSTVPEDGAVLLRLTVPAGGSIPSELRIWVYDGGGVLFANSRFPGQGTLPVPANGKDLGTILIQPGVVSGALRLHVRGLNAGARVSDAVAELAASTHDRATIDLVLSPDILLDDDGDDVPDRIDDCPAQPNPAQGGCPFPDGGDASSDTSPVADGGVPDGGGSGDLGVPNDAAAGDAARADVPTADAAVVDAAVVDAAVTDAAVADAPATDVPSSDLRAADAPVDGGVPVDVGAGDVRPTDVGTADVVKADAVSEAGSDAPRKMLGASCAGGGECASGFCADGMCCQTACDQPCQQCLAGLCLPVVRQQDVPQCAGAMTCNPTSRCVATN